MAFDIGSILGAIASAIGIGTGAKNLLGGSQQGASRSSRTYVPTGLGNADTAWQEILAGLSGRVGGQNALTDPALVNALSTALGIDPKQFLAAAQQSGNLSQGQINPALNAENALFGQAGNLVGAGNQLYQTAFDPQNALRDRYQQQLTDASRAGTSARGIGMGGESAGIENQSVSNFLQDWQNQQVGREATGLQGMSGAYNQAGRDYAGGLAAGGLAPGYALQSGATPYGAQTQASMFPFEAVNAYNTGTGPGTQNLGNLLQFIIPYLNSGQGATGQAFNQGQQSLGNILQGSANLGQGGATPWAALANIFSQPNYNTGGSAGNTWTSGYDLGGG